MERVGNYLPCNKHAQYDTSPIAMIRLPMES